MPYVDESEMLAMLDASRLTLLIEPAYDRKYPPIGLGKIARYQKDRGRWTTFARRYTGQRDLDLICITSLFTMDAGIVTATVREAGQAGVPVLVGGVYASLMPKHLAANCDGAHIFRGYSQVLDQAPPRYDRNWGIEDPWDQFSFTFTTRGCPNRCKYCAVHRIEPQVWINPRWREHILRDKPNAMISDNNLSQAPDHLADVVDYLWKQQKRVVFDNGFDCKLVTDDMAMRLARLAYTRSGMRLAFDRIEEDGVFQAAIQRLVAAGVPASQILAYVLFNFLDAPQEADYRMRECVRLRIRPYPQRFQPLNKLTRTNAFVGKQWTSRLASAFRNFWLLAGLYTKHTFADYAWSAEGRAKYRLTDEDRAAWETPWK